MTVLRVGAAKAEITPDWPVALAGFAFRKGLSERVAQPLHVRAALFETTEAAGSQRVVIVSADILHWPSVLVPDYRAEIASAVGTSPGYVLLAATHTHSAPRIGVTAFDEEWAADSRFLDLLRQRTLRAVATASRNLEPVTVARSTATFSLGMYRRCLIDGKIRFGLNPDGPVDHTVTIAAFRRADRTPAVVLVHYTCHPVISELCEISGEYPGVAMSEIERQRAGVALFLQGCCGDIDPDFTGTARVRRGGDADIVRTGRTLAQLVLQQLDQSEQELSPAELTVTEEAVALPFRHVPDRQELLAGSEEEGAQGERCRILLEHPELLRPSETLTVQRLDLADGLSLLAMNGEIVVSYGLRVRERSGGAVLPMGYSNGMIGYVPTAWQIAEGGYEAEEAALRAHKPSGFAPEIEQRINEAIDRLGRRARE